MEVLISFPQMIEQVIQIISRKEIPNDIFQIL